MAIRTFIALDLDEPIRRRLVAAQRQLADCGASVKAVEAGNLHVTLLFLGDVADERLADLCAMMTEVADAIEPFGFEVRGLLAVPPRGQLRMTWAGITESSGRLRQLQENLADAMGSLGLRQEERGFRPHVTLGRVKFASQAAHFRSAVAAMAE